MVIIHLENYMSIELYYFVHYVIYFQIFLGNLKKHYDEENDPMFENSFIAGINTPDGVVTYHIKLEYWELFDIPEIERAPKYDNYSSNDVLKRIKSLTKKNKK